LILANQGHGVEVGLQLEQREPPEVLPYGTVERLLNSILSVGLDKGNRHHAHLSKDVETARKVGAGRGRPVILAIDDRKMHGDGRKFFVLANGVWLTDSGPPGYISAI
jgi:putative RNA 2'-phosphotransferase